MQTLMGDQSASQDDRRAKMMKLRTDTNTKIEAVLTADQKTKFAKMQAIWQPAGQAAVERRRTSSRSVQAI